MKVLIMALLLALTAAPALAADNKATNQTMRKLMSSRDPAVHRSVDNNIRFVMVGALEAHRGMVVVGYRDNTSSSYCIISDVDEAGIFEDTENELFDGGFDEHNISWMTGLSLIVLYHCFQQTGYSVTNPETNKPTKIKPAYMPRKRS